MKLHSIDTGYFKLDGGAMFGVVPKVIWNKLNPADPNNLCTWAMRCLLIEEGDRLILIDTGMGNKQGDKFFSYYEPSGAHTLLSSIKDKGFSPADVTDVILTHLHFDHCGAAISKEGDQLKTTFPNATYWSNKDHWESAVAPNPRERASFLRENIIPIQESGQLKFADENTIIAPFIDIKLVHGHTDAMMIPHIKYKEHTVVYMADLIPSTFHLPIPYVMGYDIRPLDCLNEKADFLKRGLDEKHILFFEHDPQTECCTLQSTIKGIRMAESFDISTL